MIPLEQIRIASPCHANWDEMTGTEAEALIQEKEGRLCVRFYTRADGTVLTQDCPVGLRAVRVKLARKLSYAAAVLLSCGSGLLRWSGMAQAVRPVNLRPAHPHPAHTMGKPAVLHKKLSPGVGPDPFALPHTMGMIGLPPERSGVWLGGVPSPPSVMGAPAVVPPVKAHGK